jgi:hypothetical protein
MPRAVYANGPMAELQIKAYAVDFHFLQARARRTDDGHWPRGLRGLGSPLLSGPNAVKLHGRVLPISLACILSFRQNKKVQLMGEVVFCI